MDPRLEWRQANVRPLRGPTPPRPLRPSRYRTPSASPWRSISRSGKRAYLRRRDRRPRPTMPCPPSRGLRSDRSRRGGLLRRGVSEEEADERLRLVRASVRSRVVDPPSQPCSSVLGDPVDRSRPAPGRCPVGLGEAVLDEFLRLLIDPARHAGPEVAQAAPHLRGELVGLAPVADREQPQDRVGGGRQTCFVSHQDPFSS